LKILECQKIRRERTARSRRPTRTSGIGKWVDLIAVQFDFGNRSTFFSLVLSDPTVRPVRWVHPESLVHLDPPASRVRPEDKVIRARKVRPVLLGHVVKPVQLERLDCLDFPVKEVFPVCP